MSPPAESRTSPEPASELDRAAAHWSAAFTSSASAEQREAHYALAAPLYRERYLDPLFGGGDWLAWVRRTLCPDGPLGRALVLGCGLGDGLVDMHRRGIARALHGVDLSPAGIEAARHCAAAAGVSAAVTFEVGDFHSCPLPPEQHDLVFLVMSLHHALDLDQVLARVHATLRPGGHVVVNEYVGPDRWQHTYRQLFLIKALLTLLPRRLRRRPDGTVKGRIGRPTLAWMLATDPSEAAHSSAIPARLAAHFELVQRVDYGGGVAVPVLDQIMANFRPEDAGSMRWLERVLWVDRAAWRTGLVPSANAVLVGRRR